MECNTEMPVKQCKKCGLEKPATSEYFDKAKTCRDGLRSRCKDCGKAYRKGFYKEYNEKNLDIVRERNRNYTKENREKINQIKREKYKNNHEYILRVSKEHRDKNREKYRMYYARSEHKRRARESALVSTLTLEQWLRSIEYFDNKCVYCLKEPEKLTKDHFIPVSKGGEYSKDNIVPCCFSCNSSKNNKDFFRWYPSQDFFSVEAEKKILRFLKYESNNTQQLSIL